MGFNAVFFIEDGGDSALSIKRCALVKVAFAENGNLSEVSCPQSHGQTCGTAAYNQDVVFRSDRGRCCV
jgi:hypothetical protein